MAVVRHWWTTELPSEFEAKADRQTFCERNAEEIEQPYDESASLEVHEVRAGDFVAGAFAFNAAETARAARAVDGP